jgi:hypothetical protein
LARCYPQLIYRWAQQPYRRIANKRNRLPEVPVDEHYNAANEGVREQAIVVANFFQCSWNSLPPTEVNPIVLGL